MTFKDPCASVNLKLQRVVLCKLNTGPVMLTGMLTLVLVLGQTLRSESVQAAKVVRSTGAGKMKGRRFKRFRRRRHT